MSGLAIEACGVSSAGLVRDLNEDAFVLGNLDGGKPCRDSRTVNIRVAPGTHGPLLLVCDGMGGARGGAVASSLAAETIWAEMKESRITDEPAVYARLLRRAIRSANARLRHAGGRTPELYGMGTTVSAAGVVGKLLVLGQVGDSRAYLLRGNVLTQVTRDQSVVGALVQAGVMTEEESKISRERGIILQALGTARDVNVSVSVVHLRRGDTLLLCSDGLYGPVGDEAMCALLCQHGDVEGATRALHEAAIAAGGPDNVTVVVARFSAGDLPEASGKEDLPRFTEFNPSEEGDRAFAETSYVARRLARRAGLRDDSIPPAIPATGPHFIVTPSQRGAGEGTGEPNRASRLGLVAWMVVILAVFALAMVGTLLWSR